MIDNPVMPRRVLLRATLKGLTAIAGIWLLYVFLAGFFGNPELETNGQYTFDLSSLKNNDSTYFQMNRRKILAIKQNDSYYIFWANDPVYGCQLKYFNDFIKPVCIDIKYKLTGFSSEKKHRLKSPKHNITIQNKLIVY